MRQKFKWEFLYFLFFMVLLVNLVADKYKSVYPSLVFPSFSSAPIIKDEVQIPVTEIYAAAGDTNNLVQVDKKLLYYDLYAQHSENIGKTILKKVSNKSKAKDSLFIKNYFKSHLDSLYDNDFEHVFLVTGKKILYTKTGEMSDEIINKHTSHISLK